MNKLEAIKDHANKVGADATFVLGDLIDGIELLKKTIKMGVDREQFTQLDQMFSQVKNRQSLEQMLEKGNAPKENKEAYLGSYEKYQSLLKVSAGTVIEESRRVYKSMDQIFSQFNTGVYGLPGNHDPATFYEMRNIQKIDKTGSFNVEGISFLGSVNSYELIIGLPRLLFPHLSIDLTKEHIKQIAENYERIGAGKKEKIVEELLKNLPEYNRIMQNEFDYLLTHKGVEEMAMEGNRNCGAGEGISRAINQKRNSIKAVLGGHIHNHNVWNTNGLLKIRSSNNIFYEIDINENDKKIDKLQIYQV